MKPTELTALGLPQDCLAVALDTLKEGFKQKRLTPEIVRARVCALVAAPEADVDDITWGALARAVVASQATRRAEEAIWGHNPHGRPCGFSQWGTKDDAGSMEQMAAACELPVAVAGALMPDNHLGYGLPIGGVLATYGAVIPYAVGVDIACRMMLTVTDLPPKVLTDVFAPEADPLVRALTEGSVFGVGGMQAVKADHQIMDRDWNVTPITRRSKDKAWAQLGTSGSGNHFVEFGLLTLDEPDLGLEPGTFVALLSHSGSRGPGAAVCKMYSEVAAARLPKTYERFKNMAWLCLDSESGQEYWQAMNLMGEYASANHHVIHDRVTALAGARVLASVENHHNFAWQERHGDKELIVHRKGATPAGEGVLGMIPGSMADPAFVVRGKGQPESLRSASHGAGRRMSRSQAVKTFDWAEWKQVIRGRGVRLLSAGLDEVPGVYKDIREVMAQQTDLVRVVARFDPKIVRMSDDGQAED